MDIGTMTLRNNNIVINHKRVEQIMRDMNLKSRVRIKRYRPYRRAEGRIAPNFLQRDFNAKKANQK